MKIKLRQAFDLQMGKTPTRNRPDYWNGDHKWISIADIGNAGKFLTKTKESITEAGIDGSGIKVVPQGTVIMSFKLSIGKTAITSEDMYTNEAIMAFIDNGKFAIDTDYLYHLCCGTNWTAGTNKAVMGLTLNKATLLEKEIPLPDINEQHEIATKLDKIDAIIAERQQQLELIDQAVKSRFIELFGDPVTNPYGWQQLTVNDVCVSIVRGPFGSALKKEFFVPPSDTTYKVYEQKHAIQKSSTIGTYYVTAEKYNELRRFECHSGDILMSCSGTMGELYQLPAGCERGIINQALCKFTLNERILPIAFLAYMRETIGNLETKGSGIQNIAAVSYVKAMPINLPPMRVQEQFAAFVEQTDKSKYYSSLSFRYCQAAANTYRQEWMTCRTSDF